MQSKPIADRVVFPKGQQRAFLLEVKEKLNMSWDQLGEVSGCHRRSFSDWVAERYRISKPVVDELSRLSGISVPVGCRFISWESHLSMAGKRGRAILRRKYGNNISVLVDEEYRKKKWREWWEKTGKHKPNTVIGKALFVAKPGFSTKLAEFVGIVLGDGGISRRQIAITLHREDDKEYIQYVKNMILKLFEVSPSIVPVRHFVADNIVISRTELVDYCVNTLGLKIGNKVRQQIRVPKWVVNNDEYLCACVRGLIDTDGSVFTHRYCVNNREYSYKKLSFSNRSKPLLDAVYVCLLKLNLKPRRAGDHEIRLDRVGDVRTYFEKVGSHNRKHLNRYWE